MVRSHLQNGLNYAESPGSSQEPAELGSSPDDPSSLPDLHLIQLMTGITIAFKQLIMYEATKCNTISGRDEGSSGRGAKSAWFLATARRFSIV